MKKNCRTSRKIWVCNDVLMDVLPFFDRPQLGLKLALLSPRFNALVDKHFDGKHELTLWRETIIHKHAGPVPKLSVLIDDKFVGFPLPDRPMHNKIRFDDLSIEYIDHSVITFLRANHQIFNKGTDLYLYLGLPYARNAKNDQPIWNVIGHEIWPIFAPTIRNLNFYGEHALEDLRRHISPTILTDFNINSIDSSDLLPDVIANDGLNATAGQALSKWLNTPRKDGKPKQLNCRDHSKPPHITWINGFKEAFLHATTTSSTSYIIRLEDFKTAGNESFELINERTNEKLTLEKEENDDEKMEDEDDDNSVYWLLKRCTIGQTMTTVQWEDDNLNNVSFTFYSGTNTNCIGQLSPPKAGQKNAKNCLKMKPGPSGQRKKK